jgi:vitamin B12 transporter
MNTLSAQQIRTRKNLLGAAIAAIGAIASCAQAATHEAAMPTNDLMAITTLDTMVVTANRQEVPLREVAASMSVLTAEDIAAHGEANIADVLRSLPGINVSGSGGIGKTSALRIRGEESYRTLVLIDGMNISDTTAPQVSPRFEDMMSGGIERVEVLRGTQGMMYGADAGGIVNITTRRAHEPFAADAAVEYGSYDTTNLMANVRGKLDRADYSLSLTHFDTDGFNARSTDTTARDNDGYQNTTAHFNGGVQVSDVFRLETTVRNVRSQNDYDGCYDLSTFASSQRCVSDYNLTAYRVAAIYDTKAVVQRLSLQRSESSREDFYNSVGTGKNDGNIDEAQYQGIFRFTEVGDLVYGADLKQESLKSADDPTKERDQLGYYAEWQGRAAKQFYYTAGARHDNNDDFGDHTSYRASSAYLLDVGVDVLKLKASYGTGFRAPSLYEIAYNKNFGFGTAATTKLKEETSKGFDAGVEYHWHNGGSVEVVYFDQTIDDEIIFDLDAFSGYLQDRGATHSRGVESSAMYPISSTFRLLGNYTYNETKDPAGEHRLRRPRHLANIGFDAQPITAVTVFANVRIVRDTQDQIFGVGRISLDDYSAIEASVSWAVNAQLDLYVRGENLLRDDYQEVNTYNVAKGAIYAGARFHFR